MKQSNSFVGWEEMNSFVTDAFSAVGVPREDAGICADIILAADVRGIESHGVNRFKPIYYDRILQGVQNPVTNFEIMKKTMTTAVVDGHDGMGQVIGKKSMELAISMAKEFGMGMVAVRNSTHYGIAGYYVEMAAQSGCVGITGTNARPSVAPTFGIENMLGTNPLTFGMPTDEEFPFVLDCATSIIQRGKIEYYHRMGMDTPPGMVVGQDGSELTDSGAILEALTSGEAALAPLGGFGTETGGYKGYGYSAAVEILSAALQAGSFLRMLSGKRDGKPAPPALGHFFIAINTGAFEGEESFRKTAGDILRELRASKKAPGQDRIYTPGELEYLTYLERRDTGVSVTPPVQLELIQIRDEQKLFSHKFPFE